MKHIFSLFLFLSIFFINHICKAQTDMQFCGKLSGTISLQQLKDLLQEDCKSINLVDAEGNAFDLKGYTFVFTSNKIDPNSDYDFSKDKKAYVEEAKVGYVTNGIKEKLATAQPGDYFIFTNFTYLDKGKEKKINYKLKYQYAITP